MLHKLPKVQRDQSMSLSFMFIIRFVTHHLHEAAQNTNPTALKVGVKRGEKGMTLRLLSPWPDCKHCSRKKINKQASSES